MQIFLQINYFPDVLIRGYFFTYHKIIFIAGKFDIIINKEKLKEENESLKIKMMLENRVKFGEKAAKVTPKLKANFFITSWLFERQSANPKYIQLYDKIQRPVHFIPKAEIEGDKIEGAWEALAD